MTIEFSSTLLVILGFGLCAVTIAIAFTSSLLKSIILLSASSLMIGLCYLLMDAPDVAMTEAAIGACLSTIILLSFTRKINKDEIEGSCGRLLAIILSIFLIGIFIHASVDLGSYGDAKTQVHGHINQYYLKSTREEIGIRSFVAAILASYRGYDTLGETTVIFTAALAVAIIFGRKKRNVK